jgi:hypothetical protein
MGARRLYRVSLCASEVGRHMLDNHPIQRFNLLKITKGGPFSLDNGNVVGYKDEKFDNSIMKLRYNYL